MNRWGREGGPTAENEDGRMGRILMKNMMEVQAYPMEFVTQSSAGISSGTGARHGEKDGSRLNRGGGGQSNSASVMMNGNVTCLFWEETTPTVDEDDVEEKKGK